MVVFEGYLVNFAPLLVGPIALLLRVSTTSFTRRTCTPQIIPKLRSRHVILRKPTIKQNSKAGTGTPQRRGRFYWGLPHSDAPWFRVTLPPAECGLGVSAAFGQVFHLNKLNMLGDGNAGCHQLCLRFRDVVNIHL